MAPLFLDRQDAGRRLAAKLSGRARDQAVVVLGLPRGGVVVAFEVSEALFAPLDVYVVRKLGVPGREELALGAIASGGVRVLNRDVVSSLGLPASVIDAVAAEELQEIERRERAYRGARPRIDLRGRTVILVDDGLATGSTMRAATVAVRRAEPTRIVVAVPVASRSTSQELERLADEFVCLATPEPFHSVSLWYDDFEQTTDDEVRMFLERARARGLEGGLRASRDREEPRNDEPETAPFAE